MSVYLERKAARGAVAWWLGLFRPRRDDVAWLLIMTAFGGKRSASQAAAVWILAVAGAAAWFRQKGFPEDSLAVVQFGMGYLLLMAAFLPGLVSHRLQKDAPLRDLLAAPLNARSFADGYARFFAGSLTGYMAVGFGLGIAAALLCSVPVSRAFSLDQVALRLLTASVCWALLWGAVGCGWAPVAALFASVAIIGVAGGFANSIGGYIAWSPQLAAGCLGAAGANALIGAAGYRQCRRNYLDRLRRQLDV